MQYRHSVTHPPESRLIDELETVAQAYVNDDMECEEIAWIKGFSPHQEFIQLVTRQNAEEVIAAERMKLEATAKVGLQLTTQIEALEADNKRLREALEFIEGIGFVAPKDAPWVHDEAIKVARAALGEMKT